MDDFISDDEASKLPPDARQPPQQPAAPASQPEWTDFYGMVKAATQGDKDAQLELAKQQVGAVAGAVGLIGEEAAGWLPKLEQFLGIKADNPKFKEFVNSAINKNLLPQDMISKAMQVINRKKMADGGAVTSATPDFIPDGQMPAGDESVAPDFMPEGQMSDEEKYGTTIQTIKAGLEGIAQGVVGPLAPLAEKAAGVNPEDIRLRAEQNPTAHYAGEMAGLGGSLLSGVGEGALVEKLGAAGAKAAGLAEGTGTLAKVGSSAVKGAIENMAVSGSDEMARHVWEDPNQSAESALVDVGLSGLIGGGISGGISTVSPLWSTTFGSKTNGLLKSLTRRLGGQEPSVDNAVQNAITNSGMDIAPEVRAAMSSDPAISHIAKTLEQSDTTASGLAYQETLNNVRKQAGDVLAATVGHTPETIESAPELSNYEAGKSLGKALAKEYQDTLDPLVKEFDRLRDRYGDIPLNDLQEPVLEKAEGVENPVSPLLKQISNKVSELANNEQWNLSPSSPISREVNRVLTEVQGLKTLNDLSGYIKQVTVNMQANPLDGSMVRAGSMIKGVLKDAEAEAIGNRVGETEGADARDAFKAVRAAYKRQADLQEALDSRLHIGGSTAGYAKRIAEMGQTDGETLLRRLSGVGDADALNLLRENFPQSAKLLKQYHADKLVSQAASKARPGEALSSSAFLRNVNNMSPEVRNFVFSPDQLAKVRAIETITDELNKMPHNFSNTARTLDNLFKYVPATALGLASALFTHNAETGLLVGAAVKAIGKDAPDAARLALLKFLGSDRKVSPMAFKAMTDLFDSSIKGAKLMSNAAKNVFVAGKEVIPQSMVASESDRNKLDKSLQTLNTDPQKMFALNSHLGHYLPDHATSLSTTAARTVSFLNSNRPNAQKLAPLDSDIEPTDAQRGAFNNLLNIAQQPLSVLAKVKNGNVTPQDVQAIQTMYPGFYKAMVQKLGNELINAKSKGTVVPYKTRIGLSLFMGQPLDSTLMPQSILIAQPIPAQSQQPNIGAIGSKPKRGTASLGKMPNAFMTPGQAREARQAHN